MKKLLFGTLCTLVVLCGSCSNVKENQYLGKLPYLSDKYWNEWADLMHKQQNEENPAKYNKIEKQRYALEDEYNKKYKDDIQPLIGRHLPFVCDESLPYVVDSVVITEADICQVKAAIYMHVKEAHNYTIQHVVYGGEAPSFYFFFIFANSEGKAIAAAQGALFEYKKYAKDEPLLRETQFLTRDGANTLYADFAQIEFLDSRAYTQKCNEAKEQANQ